MVCFLLSLYVLNQVFFPLRQCNQYYLMWFLAFVLPLDFICYRPGLGRKKEVGERVADAAEEVAASATGPSTATGSADPTQGSPTSARTSKAKTQPPSKPQRSTDNPSVIDWILVVVTFLTCAYPVLPFCSGGFNEFLNRQGSLSTLDVTMGGILLLLILEATRR
ncbi:C4-dicarboxylate ABC transporter permease, partial [Burkholderia multivorans]